MLIKTCWFHVGLIGLSAIGQPLAQAQIFTSPVDQLPAVERAALQKGTVLVEGETGRYIGRVLIPISAAQAWSVLTDYSRFSQFLPNVVSSRILETQGNRKLIEQVDERTVLLVRIKSRLRSEIKETPTQRIDFRRVAGDVPKLDGHWTIEPVAPYAGAAANQVLITQVVEVQPATGTPSSLFYNLFKNVMRDNLKAIRREMQRRSQPSSSS